MNTKNRIKLKDRLVQIIMKNLLNVKEHTRVKIKAIVGGMGVQQKLVQLGIGVDSTVIVRRSAPFAGPLMLECNGRSVVIGRGIAFKIMVEEIS